jgi:hypothetical protein
MGLLPADFKSAASANFAIRALELWHAQFIVT